MRPAQEEAGVVCSVGDAQIDAGIPLRMRVGEISAANIERGRGLGALAIGEEFEISRERVAELMGEICAPENV